MATAKNTGNRWSKPVAIGAKGVSLAIAEMYDHQIVPCVPLMDIGYDLIAAHNHVLKRVQVKATSVAPERPNGLLTFSVKRRKAMKANQKTVAAISYTGDEIDAFIFVHTKMHVFFIVPADQIKYSRYKISFSLTSRWRDAWHLLKF